MVRMGSASPLWESVVDVQFVFVGVALGAGSLRP